MKLQMTKLSAFAKLWIGIIKLISLNEIFWIRKTLKLGLKSFNISMLHSSLIIVHRCLLNKIKHKNVFVGFYLLNIWLRL